MYCDRPQWVHDTMGERTLLQLILDVHMTATGSFPRYDNSGEEDVRSLLHVFKTWTPSTGGTEEFDKAVYNLIAVTLWEAAYLSQKQEEYVAH